jgi:uncharacterized membrane protein YgcG
MVPGHATCVYWLSQTREITMAEDRELIEPNEGDKRFVRRDEEGKFKESDDVGRSLSQDQKRDAQTESKPGQGDKGDRSSSGGSSGVGGTSTGSGFGGGSGSSSR